MALNLPTLATPYGIELTNAYAWLSGLALDLSANTGRCVLNVNPDEAAWQSTPVVQVAVSLGQVLTPGDPTASPPVEPTLFPTLSELMSDPEFAQAYSVIGAKLYAALLAHPALAGATVVGAA